MNNLFFKNASLDFEFSNYITAFSVFNEAEALVPEDNKLYFNNLKNNYKSAVKNIDSEKSKQILKEAASFFKNLVKIEKEAQIRLNISQEERQQALRPYGEYANRHLWAQAVIREAFKKLFGRLPTASEEQMAQSIALLESSYGAGWKGVGKGSNNWGAIQCCKPKNGQCPANTFLYTDSSPSTGGKSTKYQVCFKKYNSPVDGAVDLLKEIFKSGYKQRGSKTQTAAQIGSIPMFSASMYDSSYYQGFGKDREERIRNHAKAVKRNADIITKATNTPLAIAGNINAIPTEEQITQYVASGPQMQNKQPSQVYIQNKELDNEYNSLMKHLFAKNSNEYISKKAVLQEKLPLSKNLIKLENSPFEFRVRLANILVTAFRNYFDAETSIHSDNKDTVELEVDMLGTKDATAKALKIITASVSDVFEEVVKNKIDSNVYMDKRSSLPLLSLDVSEKCFRKFALRVW